MVIQLCEYFKKYGVICILFKKCTSWYMNYILEEQNRGKGEREAERERKKTDNRSGRFC